MQLQALSTPLHGLTASRQQPASSSPEAAGPRDGFAASRASEPIFARPQLAAPATEEAKPTTKPDPTALGEKQFADSFGRVKHLALMISPYSGGRARQQILSGYKQLFTKMEPDTKFTIVCETSRDVSDVQKALADSGAPNPERVQILKPNVGSLTVWARDMMVPLQLTESDTHVALLAQQPLHDWHDNDKRVPKAICDANPNIILHDDKRLVTDGGDTMSTTKDSFVGNYSMTATAEKVARDADADPKYRAEIIANFEARTGKQVVDGGGRIELPQNFRATETEYQLIDNTRFEPKRLGPNQADMAEVCRSQAVSLFESVLGKPVTTMGVDDPATQHVEEPASDHMDMGMTPIDDQTMFVGSPALAKQIIGKMSAEEIADAEAKLSEAAGHEVRLTGRNRDNQEDFDAYAKTVSEKGYNVVRVPHLEPGYSSSYITYNNCLMERFTKEDGTDVRRVFLPVYDIPKLDNAAIGTWQENGYEVIPMPLGALSQRWGALRCISNWLDRDPHG